MLRNEAHQRIQQVEVQALLLRGLLEEHPGSEVGVPFV